MVTTDAERAVGASGTVAGGYAKLRDVEERDGEERDGEKRDGEGRDDAPTCVRHASESADFKGVLRRKRRRQRPR